MIGCSIDLVKTADNTRRRRERSAVVAGHEPGLVVRRGYE